MRITALIISILLLLSSSSFAKTNTDKLNELKDIYEKGGISEAEYKATKKIFSTKEDKSDKKLKKNKKSFSLKKKSTKKIKLNLSKNKKDEDEEEITIKKLEELGDIVKFDESFYPSNMKKKFLGCNNSFKCRGKKAGSYMWSNFSKSPTWGQKYPGKMIKSMAMYEVFYASRLYEDRKSINRFIENKYKKDFFSKNKKEKDKKAIRSLFGMNKGRKNMREALGMTMETSSQEAILRFWMLGEFLELGSPQRHAKIDKDLIERQKMLDLYKASITTLKKTLEEKEENKNKEDKKS